MHIPDDALDEDLGNTLKDQPWETTTLVCVFTNYYICEHIRIATKLTALPYYILPLVVM